jgi:hypothetical protein
LAESVEVGFLHTNWFFALPGQAETGAAGKQTAVAKALAQCSKEWDSATNCWQMGQKALYLWEQFGRCAHQDIGGNL